MLKLLASFAAVRSFLAPVASFFALAYSVVGGNGLVKHLVAAVLPVALIAYALVVAFKVPGPAVVVLVAVATCLIDRFLVNVLSGK